MNFNSGKLHKVRIKNFIKHFIQTAVWAAAGTISFAFAGKDHGVNIPANLSLDSIPVCFNFACKRRVNVNLPLSEWAEVAGWFDPAAQSPLLEREQIKKAIGWMEVVIGRHTPTHKDLAFDLPKIDDLSHLFPGQQDCIDEAVNTTVYLLLFEQNALLKHHIVMQSAYRRGFFDQHWAGQIKEKSSGKRYVVDSWFQPNGYLPIIQSSPEWQDISLFSAVIDDSPRDDVSADDLSADAVSADVSPANTQQNITKNK